MDILYNDLLLELECPVCTEYMTPPIQQCKTGHSICSECRKKLPKCPLCQEPFSEARNMTLETLAGKMQYPCINRAAGCQARLLLSERENHEKNCPFKKYSCPMNGCKFVGSIGLLRAHWESKKVTSKPYSTKNVCHTKLRSESYYVNLVEAYDDIFWFKCKTESGKIYWAVQYIGDQNKASNYYYEVEVVKQGQPKRKVTFSDYCQSIEISNEVLFRNNNCMFTSVESLDSYVGNDQLLIYYLKMFKSGKCQDSKKENAEVEENQRRQYKPRDKSAGPAGLKKNLSHKKFQKNN